MLTKSSAQLTLFDKLSRLSFITAAKLLGPEGNRLIRAGGTYDIDIATQVRFDRDGFQLTLGDSLVTISLNPAVRDRLDWRCNTCTVPCEHAGAAFSLILEEKLALGLADAPPDPNPLESLGEPALIAQAVAEREERARTEKMQIVSANPQTIWTDYTLVNSASGKSYRVALRGWQPGESYCSCPDFRKNTLGTCKHILHALEKVRRRSRFAIGHTAAAKSVCISPMARRWNCTCSFRRSSTSGPWPSCSPSATEPLPTCRICSGASAALKPWTSR